MKKYLLFVFLGVSMPHILFAAGFDFHVGSKLEQYVPIKVSLYLQVPEGPINTLSGILSYDPEFLTDVKVTDGGSIVGAWIEEPIVNSGKVSFAALIPGGAGEGSILTLTATAKSAGTTMLKVVSGDVFMNDGTGEKVAIKPTEIALDIAAREEGFVAPDTDKVLPDTTKPEPFSVQVARDPNIFNNAWFIVFAARDSQSGIDYYEVGESVTKNGEPVSWERTKSPYILKDQSRQQYIFVKAVDHEGNSRIETVLPLPHSKFNLGNMAIYGIILGALIVFSLVFWIFRKKQNAEKNNE